MHTLSSTLILVFACFNAYVCGHSEEHQLVYKQIDQLLKQFLREQIVNECNAKLLENYENLAAKVLDRLATNNTATNASTTESSYVTDQTGTSAVAPTSYRRFVGSINRYRSGNRGYRFGRRVQTSGTTGRTEATAVVPTTDSKTDYARNVRKDITVQTGTTAVVHNSDFIMDHVRLVWWLFNGFKTGKDKVQSSETTRQTETTSVASTTESEISNVSETNARFLEKFEELTAKIGELNEKNTELDEKVEDLASNNTNLNAINVELSRKIEKISNVSQSNAILLEKFENLATKIDGLDEKNTELDEKVKDLDSNNTNLNKINVELSRKIEQICNVSESNAILLEKFENLAPKIDGFNDKNAELDEKVKNLASNNTNLNAINAQLSRKIEQMTNVTKKFENLTEVIGRLNANNTDLSKRIELHATNITELVENIAALESIGSKIEIQNNAILLEKFENFTKMIDRLNENNTKLNEDIDRLKKKNTQLKDEIDGIGEKNIELNTSNTKLGEKVESLNENTTNLYEKNEELSKKIERQTTKITELFAINTELNTKIERLNVENTNLKRKTDLQATNNAEQTERIAKLEAIVSGRGNVLLVGGGSFKKGRVEVLYNGTWGTVCDDHWNDGQGGKAGKSNSDVVCKQLGFSRATWYSWIDGTNDRRYGDGTGQIWLDDAKCTGSENIIFDCPHRTWGSHNCGHGEDVAVECE